MKNAVIKALLPTGLSEEELISLIEVPKDEKLGDFAFPCFTLSRKLKKNPVEIAKEISADITSSEFEKVEAVGPYINFFVNRKEIASRTINKIRKEKEKYGSSRNKGTVMVEFSQANTHKAFHVGHIRATATGESLARIIEFSGNKVIRANYQGDTGMHVAKWIWCYQKYHKNEKIQESESWIASIYVDAVKKLKENPDLQEEVDIINKNLESGKDKSLNALWKKTRDLSLKAYEKIYKELNTHFDRYYFERELEKRGKEIALDLLNKGIAKMSEGAEIVNFEEQGMGIWVLLRKDGTVLYSAKDLALAELKFKEYKLKKSIAEVGMAQSLHVKQILETLKLMKFPQVNKYQFVHHAEVRLPTGKMSSRTGENILYSDFINEMKEYAKSEISKRESLKGKELEDRALSISIAAIKYTMLKQSPNSVIVFNKEEALNFEGNTGPYLLYTYARAKSILRKANKKIKKLEINHLEEKEKYLILQLALFPQVVSRANESLSPNLIANYAYHISQLFNEFYHTHQVIGSENESFRLSLVESFSQVLKNSLLLLGINTIERM